MADPKHLVRTHRLTPDQTWRGRHPFNPKSEMRIARLGDMTGMSRVPVNLIRIPPGKESFIPHAHAVQEEFVYILEGSGEAVLDGAATSVGPGDFLGFPTDGVVHNLVNTGSVDLVYLSGGERTPVEVADMPTIGRTTVFRPGSIALYGEDGVERLTLREWMARAALGEDA